jgi:ASC-1-like (ASCH) protein
VSVLEIFLEQTHFNSGNFSLKLPKACIYAGGMTVPLFMIRKQFFEQYKSGKQDVELRKMRPQWKNSRVGNQAVLMCGKDILRKRILKVHTGSLARMLLNVNYRRIFPDARTIFEANRLAREIYREDKEFMAFELV